MDAERTLEIPLISNGYRLSTAPERQGWLTPSDPGRPVKQLWEQFHQQGYLWLRGLLDRTDVFDFRRRYFAAFARSGLVAPGSDPRDGLYSNATVDQQAAREVLVEAVRWAAYEAFCLSKPIYRFYEEALGGAVYLHKRKLIRYTRPGEANCTGAHYDLTYLRAGTDRVYTSWIPIGDIPVEMGGLVYLEGSHAWGRQKEAEFSILNAQLPAEERLSAYNRNMTETGWLTKDLPSLAERLNTRWLCADYEAGDMLIHSAYMIHAATENRDPAGRMRLSTDIRYQLVSDQIDARWAQDWAPDDEKRF
jgi:ectoine hydroxylase-related dioxygenase (phytanoyl-CoA dioxygenase family)